MLTLSPGARVGPYEILAPLGRGGMGEVWRARDTKLRREVAIKALPAEFARDSERRARFEREAHLLASLNHPNVGAIFGLEEAGDDVFLVLELVEGETLDEKLAAGALPLPETLAIASQIAAGLSAAHEAGVIHRDLKPSNIKVKSDGSVKVLDLGLARVIDSAPTGDASKSPTVTTGGTRSGVILGTAAYMSPEQARGKPLDRRTDVFSFGCILYECLAGRQVFREETVSDTLAAVIRSEPDWAALPADTPPGVRRLLKRCLQKDAARRLHDISDARLEIEEALAGPDEAAALVREAEPASPSRKARLPGIGLSLLLGALIGAALVRVLWPAARIEQARAIHSAIPLPAGASLLVTYSKPSLAFSPDGRKLVFRGVEKGASRLYLRDLGRTDAVPIPGTEGAFDPFFSPDGEWLAFFAGSQLRKVAVAGGAPTALADTPPVSQGGTWGFDGSILLAPRPNGGLARLLPGAREYQWLTRLDATRSEQAQVHPQLLPDGQNVLFIVRNGKDFDDLASSSAAVLSLSTGERRTLVEGATFARFAEPGYLLFAKGTTLFAAHCDRRRWELTGPAAPLVRDVMTLPSDAAPYAAVSDTGLLAFVPGGAVVPPPDTLLWVDRSGREEPLAIAGRRFVSPRLSPDGKRLAITAYESSNGHSSIAIYDFGRSVLSILTPEPGRHFSPAWSPDGRRIAFATFEGDHPRLAWKAADGGTAELLSPGERPEFPTSFSPDGRSLLYTASPGSTENMDLWLLSLGDRREHGSWISGPARELAGFFSPDGRAVAYVSMESARPEVYVRPYPGPGGAVKVSAEGGSEPAWARDGRELFYRSADSLMVVPIQTQPAFSAGAPRALIPDRYDRWSREDGSRNYDVSPDGKRFLFVTHREVRREPVTQLNLVVNWPSELDSPGRQ
jgi:Tol biopolymer transport system component